MVATNCYASAAIPEPVTILGLRLKPFSLGHYFKLKRFGCAFVADGDATADVSDLLLGVLVCHMSSDVDPGRDEFLKFIQEKGFDDEAFRWVKKVSKGCDIKQAMIEFAAYIEKGSAPPAYWETERSEDASESGAHISHVIYDCLISSLGYSPNEALNIPFSRAMFDYFRHAEAQGLIEFMHPDEVNHATHQATG
jgi:hypothetical protein